MWNEDQLRKLTVRCFSQGSKHWRHTHYGRKSHARRGSRDSVSEGSSSSGGSQPSSPLTEGYVPSIASSYTYLKSSIKIITWNVDFMAPNARTRLFTVLQHIQYEVLGCNADDEQPEPCCILLQEVHPGAFPEILDNDWIRQHFCVMPVKPDDWPDGHYGNVTLVSRTIPVLNAQLLQFGNSFMGRHAIVVDLRLDAPGPHRSMVTVRVANVHLESLPVGTSMRPLQLSSAADMLREDGIHAGVIAGDMNAITPEDGFIHEQADLLDAWKGDEEEEEALTWGHQPPSKYPPGRLDKVLYTPNGGCTVEEPDRVGVGLKTMDGQWASDHCGLVTVLRVR
ncbi:Endonuclease/exonuclease/phosphatase [Irpex rosettiformis]|uniref:Endonuclease/exonuclease/phosphatase n=1 Tax=Irpex rosettiformis TaxID=378272 RepID=A0ACB8UAR9_9APHY|nr:Endonuclease/exonuclease/phosphatase [Irpex rosettiformis]